MPSREERCWHICLVPQDETARRPSNIDEETRATEQWTNLKRLRDAVHARGSAEAIRE
jgi:hypothetical protein